MRSVSPEDVEAARLCDQGLEAIQGRTRYYHLDALRGVLMMLGILVHTSTLAYSPVLAQAVRVSGWVRMEGFFIISGFLSYMLLERYGRRATIIRRLLSVGVPFVICLVLLNPFTNFMVYSYHNSPIPFIEYLKTGGSPGARGPMVWSLHLWFLPVLLFFGLVSPSLRTAIDSAGDRLDALAQRFGDWITFGGLCGLVAFSCLAGRVFYEFALESTVPKPFLFIAKSTLNYLPFFALGMVLFRSRRLFAVFSRIHGLHLLASGGTMFLAICYFDQQPKLVAETFQLLANAYLAMTLSSFLFFIFGKLFPRKSTVALYLSDAAYSVYLLHYLVIYVLASGLRPMFGNAELLLWIVAPLTLGVTLLIHHLFIRRFAVFRAAFNGKFPWLMPKKI